MQEINSATVVTGQQKFSPKLSNWRCSKAELENDHFCTLIIFPPHASTNLKRQLYLSLVRSHLTYCSQLWRPRLIKDIEILERIQRRATKYIIGNNQMDYKSRLLSLHLLPLMHWLELQDITFLVKCLQQPTANPEIASLVSVSYSCTHAG